jgi:hypothetical protein
MSDESGDLARQLERDRRISLAESCNSLFSQELSSFERSEQHSEAGYLIGFRKLKEEKARRYIDGVLSIRRDLISRFPPTASEQEFIALRAHLERHAGTVLNQEPRNRTISAHVVTAAQTRVNQAVKRLKAEVRRNVDILKNESRVPLAPAARQTMKDAKTALTLDVFTSYSHKDEGFHDELAKHLKPLEREGLIRPWHDRKITAGKEFDREISNKLESAGIILLLISPDFISSEYCWGVEMTRAMERHESGSARVIPIILRAVDWHSAPFGKLNALPPDGKPVGLWTNPDEAYLFIARGIRAVAQEMIGVAQANGEKFTEIHGGKQHPSGATDPIAGSPQAAYHRSDSLAGFKSPFEVFLRHTEAEWVSERDSEPFSVETGKTIMSNALREVTRFRSGTGEGQDTINGTLDDAAKGIRRLQRHQVFIDGGVSFRQFWKLGDDILKQLNSIADLMAEHPADR